MNTIYSILSAKTILGLGCKHTQKALTRNVLTGHCATQDLAPSPLISA